MRIDILKAFDEKPQELDFVLPSFLAGTVGALVAPGSTGKSYFALEAAMGVACTKKEGDLLDLNAKNGAVVYINAEDPEAITKSRLYAIGTHLNSECKTSISQNLYIEPMLGKRLNIIDDAQRKRIINYCTGARLIIFDTLSRIHNLDENNNSHASTIISCLENIASETGASVLFLHHVSKSSSVVGGGGVDNQHAARGASALIDNARWCSYVTKMTKDEASKLSEREFSKTPIGDDFRNHYIRFGVSKQNYGVPFCERWYKFHAGGVLLPADFLTKKEKTKGGRNE